MLGVLGGIIVAGFLLRRQRLVTLVVLIGIAAAYFVVVGTKESREKDKTGGYESSVVRQYSFANAVDKIQARPLLGSGAGTYDDFISELNIGLRDPNNIFLLTWAGTGRRRTPLVALAVGVLCEIPMALQQVARAIFDGRGRGRRRDHVVPRALPVRHHVDSLAPTSMAFAMIGLMLATLRLAAQAETQSAVTAREPAPIRRPSRVAVPSA